MKTRPFFLWKWRLSARFAVSIAGKRFILEDTMFAESIIETSWSQRTRRSWTTLTSFGLQVVVLGLLLSLPLLRTVGIPLARTVSVPVSFGHVDTAPPKILRPATGSIVPIVAFHGHMMMPTRIPNTIPPDRGAASDTPIGSDGDRLGVIGPAMGSSEGLPIPLGGTRPLTPVPAAPSVRQFRTSSMLQGSLIRRVEPVYPPLARSARIQGAVVLAAIISKAGSIEHLQVLSGHPLLVSAAVDAVSQWRYRPYVLNGEVIEVETQITINFKLN